MFRRFLHVESSGEPGWETQPAPGAGAPGAGAPGSPGETATVRQIVARLEALPAERARFLAGFAYVMSRAAQADFDISPVETQAMETALVTQGGLDEAQAVLVVEMAKLEARRQGATEDYLVTREFARLATLDEKLAVVRCCFVVGAADLSISAAEASVVNEIARELDLDAHLVNQVRAEFIGQLSAIQAQRRLLDPDDPAPA